ncbi:hypothetical protein BLNAU_10237 [Blattamonas nauphoetae]|uniref:EF-hand domain-containing protein n=1 Tax=Blattamonas nauphoetae TaxID=2049346 RepID=A0ABQ9XTD8_9EUKA|nr:hypothetical protein BLNAU_10237 [Blattamonas nauphoetae]
MQTDLGNDTVVESEESIMKIFKVFDIKNDGVIDFDEVKMILKSVQFYPSIQTIKDMIKRVDKDRDGVISFHEFANMRRNEEVCELNVLAQFKKFDASPPHHEDGVPEDAIQSYISEFMTLDTNGDDKVSFLDLYESMMTRIPEEWLEWIFDNVKRGVKDETLLDIMVENGFNELTAARLIEKTKRDGKKICFD